MMMDGPRDRQSHEEVKVTSCPEDKLLMVLALICPTRKVHLVCRKEGTHCSLDCLLYLRRARSAEIRDARWELELSEGHPH